MDKHMILKPRLSEKSYGLSQSLRTYIFEVPIGASKQAVANAVAAQFNVTVTKVNVANSIGKPKRTMRKGGRSISGRSAASRRAYVTLKDGDSLPIFAAIEGDTDVPAEKPAKEAKSKKETK